jgi:membrane protein
MNRCQLYGISKKAFKDWIEDNAFLRAAAITYFIIFTLPTLLLVVIAIFSQFLGQHQAVGIVVQQVTAVAGPSVAELFRLLLVNSSSPFTSVWTAIAVVGFSVGGAIGVFSVFRDTLDCIWEVKMPKDQPWRKRIRQKIMPFTVVSFLGLVVIIWTAITSTLFNAIVRFSVDQVFTFVALEIAQIILSFGLVVLLLAIIYKVLTEATVHWQDVALASIITSVAITITNYIFGFYVQAFVVTTVGGAAGVLLIILLWIFVFNMSVLYGVEVSKVYAVTVGTHSKQNLPNTIRRVIKPLQKTGQRIEQAAKGKNYWNL